jgi:LmbE family N-acetylglucosaminyl deacetylase
MKLKNCFSLAILSLAMLFFSTQSKAQYQPYKSQTAAELYQNIKKLKVLGSVLYVAAHPDDENTQLLAYLSKNEGIRTGYLSLTRGDGGQNLIGKEVREELGVIRTQELLAARRIDGAQQFFTRANDFGYSKHPNETFKIWDSVAVLADAVWVIRSFRPDVIITRFDPKSAGETHGHHTASAMIAVKAFELAGNANAFPEQLKYVDVWQPKRILWNLSWWYYRNKKLDETKLIKLDVGAYIGTIGKSVGEIAAESRTNHKSQGFGSRMNRGEIIEYFQPLPGDPGNIDGLFNNLAFSWSSRNNGDVVLNVIDQISNTFSFDHPENSVELLSSLHGLLSGMEKSFWVNQKLREIELLMLQCAGIWSDAIASEYRICAGDSLKIKSRIISRSALPVKLEGIELNTINETLYSQSIDKYLTTNTYFNQAIEIKTPVYQPLSNPYWLNYKGTDGLFRVDEQKLIGKAQNDHAYQLEYHLNLLGVRITLGEGVYFSYEDPVKGEVYRPLEVAPAVTANFLGKAFVFGDSQSKKVEIVLKNQQENSKGTLALQLPKGWTSQPASINFDLKKKYAEQIVSFTLTPPIEKAEGEMKLEVVVDGKKYNRSLTEIAYDHFPAQTLFPIASAKIVRVDMQRKGNKIGYIVGAGDEIPEALQQVGYQVDILKESDINAPNLKQYDAIIAGIRAFNTNARIGFYQPILMDYVSNGGTYIVQYNNNFDLFSSDFGPYPLKISRDRVTVENAPVKLLATTHKVLNEPNKIEARDFEGWVQERGLYFISEWDSQYTAILESNDPGETPKQGSLLVAEYGKGYYVYSSISMFRQLPQGVSGAYRLFVNMVSLSAQ